MNWELAKQPQLFDDGLKLETVLAEYEGPAIAIFSSGAQKYIGVAADRAGQFVRWIEAPVTGIELEALQAGLLTVRDSIFKDPVFVADRDPSGQPCRRAWSISPDEIPDEFLPDLGAFLPGAVKTAHIAGEPKNAKFYLDGDVVRARTIAIRGLGEFLQALQRVWNALAQSIVDKNKTSGPLPQWLSDQASLALAATAPGSFRVELEPADADTHAQISELYEKLALAAQQSDWSSHMVASGVTNRVMSAYLHYLEVIDQSGLQVLSEVADRRVFLGASTARRIRRDLEKTPDNPRELLHVVGAFIGWNFDAMEFEFFDKNTEEPLKGKISAEATYPPSIVVGSDALYEVQIQSFIRWSGRTMRDYYELVSVLRLK